MTRDWCLFGSIFSDDPLPFYSTIYNIAVVNMVLSKYICSYHRYKYFIFDLQLRDIDLGYWLSKAWQSWIFSSDSVICSSIFLPSKSFYFNQTLSKYGTTFHLYKTEMWFQKYAVPLYFTYKMWPVFLDILPFNTTFIWQQWEKPCYPKLCWVERWHLCVHCQPQAESQ